MGSEEFLKICNKMVREYTDDHIDKTDIIPNYETYVVWYCKTLQNHKALLSTSLPDGMYYEITFNGDKKEIYFDAYKKYQNVCVKVGE